MGTRKDKIDKSKNDKRPKFKMIERFKEIDTGKFYPDRWRILHEDGTFSEDVDKMYLDKEFGPEYTSFVKTIGSSKYIPRPQFANKDSHLEKWSSLLRANTPSVLYQQDDLSDLCIPKAFASVLHYAGFHEVAKEINSKFNDPKYCYSLKDPNLSYL